MSIVEIHYEARCKHCKHLKRDFKTKKGGKKNNELISMKDKACNLFEL